MGAGGAEAHENVQILESGLTWVLLCLIFLGF